MTTFSLLRISVYLTLGSLVTACGGSSGSSPVPVTPVPIGTATPVTTVPSSTPVATPTPKPTSTAPGATPAPVTTSTPVATATPTTHPTSTPTPAPTQPSANASGTVVDFATNTGLAGENVAIAPYTHGAPALTVATTAANGSFEFTASPGNYLIIIGSNSPTDTRATYHNEITLTAGTNNLTQGVPTEEPNVTLSAAQSSGNFRLATLTSVEQSCVNGLNSGRVSIGLGTLVPDENAFEYMRAQNTEEAAQNTDTPTPLFSENYTYNTIGSIGNAAGANFATCQDYTNLYTFSPSSAPYAYATNPNAVWYAADWNTALYTDQFFLNDPR